MTENDPEVRLCGRPTKAGTPCRNPLGVYDAACKTHVTEADSALRARLREVWKRGYEVGRQTGREEVNLAASRAASDERERRLFRTHENGRQIVVVDGRYSYTAPPGEELAVGDEVLVPSNWLMTSHWATVSGIGTSYDGELRSVLRSRTAVCA